MITLKMIPSISILLLTLISFSSSVPTCPDVEYVEECNTDDSVVCEKVTANAVCTSPYQLQIQEGSRKYEYIGDYKCDDGVVSGKRKDGGTKILDADSVRCAKEVCKATPVAVSGCVPEGECIPAIFGKGGFTCEVGQLEAQHPKWGAWIQIQRHICTGDEQTVDVGTSGIQSFKNTRCRKDKVAVSTCDSYVVDQCEPNEYTSKCTKPGISGSQVQCAGSSKIQAYFDVWADISSKNGFTVECNSNKIVMKEGGLVYEPQQVRCIEPAICEIKIDIGDLSNCPDVDHCVNAIIDPTKNMFICSDPLYKIEGKATTDWAFLESVPCYNNAIFPVISGKLTNVDQNYKLRCRKENVCDIGKKFFYPDPKCDADDDCARPTVNSNKDLECSDNTYQLQATNDNVVWNDAPSIKCEKEGFKAGTGQVIKTARCVRKKIDNFFNPFKNDECISGSDNCARPVGYAPMKCDPGYGLQVKAAGLWTNVKSIFANSDKFKDEKNILLPEVIRCIQKDTTNILVENECIPEKEICRKPTGSDPMECDTGYGLQMKLDPAATTWTDVKTIFSNSDKFIVDDKEEQPAKIQCVRRRCSICNKMCPTCADPPIVFTPSSNWDKCASFQCEANTRTVIGSDTFRDGELMCDDDSKVDEFMWKMPNGTKIVLAEGGVKCEKLCTKLSQLNSVCDPNDNLCETMLVNDDSANFESLKCDGSIVHKSKIHANTSTGSELECDKETGEWKLTIEDRKITVAAEDNVYCRYNDCNKDEFCKQCEQDENSTSYRCPDRQKAIVSSNSSYNPTSFSCLKGKWVDDQKKLMQVTDKVECQSADTSYQTGGSKDVFIALGIVFAIIIIAIILTCIVCKLSGNGWLHAIILAKIRGDKKKNKKKNRKDKKDKKGSSKANSPSVASGKGSKGTTEKEAGTPDQGSSAEPANRPSGETLEGVSCTGVTGMSERNTMEGGSIDPMNPPQPPQQFNA